MKSEGYKPTIARCVPTALKGRNLSANAVAKSFTYAYNSANQRTRVTREDGGYWSYEYDALGHLTSAKKKLANDNPLAGHQFGYDYDTLGNRKTATFGGDATGANGLHTINYTANQAGDRNQYSSLTAPGVILTTGKANLDAAVTVNGEAAQVRHGEFFSHQTTVSNGAGPVELDITVTTTEGGQSDSVTRREFVDAASRNAVYDADGNMTFDGYRDYTWDAENRLLSVQTRAALVPAGGSEYKVDYQYDYLSRRILRHAQQKLGNAWYTVSQTRYIYDGWNVIAELGGNPASPEIVHSYLWGLDLSGSAQGAGGVSGLLAIQKHNGTNAGVHFATFDGNGNVAALASAADGTLSASYEYDAFGNLLEMSGAFAASNPYPFSTKPWDAETRLHYYGYRWYDPVTGRWVNRDPIAEAGGVNLYGFVENDGVGGVDRLGLEDVKGGNVKRRVFIMGGPDGDRNDAHLPSESVFSPITQQYDFTFGDKFQRIKSHSTAGTDAGLKTVPLIIRLLQIKEEWEQGNPRKKCCVDFDGQYVEGQAGDPLTPSKIRQYLSQDSVLKSNKIYLLAHEINKGSLLLGVGSAKHPKGTQVVDWAAPFTMFQIFYPAQKPVSVEIYTCFSANLPTDLIGGGIMGGAQVTIVPIGSPKDFTHWNQFQPTVLKPWVQKECQAHSKPK